MKTKLLAFVCLSLAAFSSSGSAQIVYIPGSGGPWTITTSNAMSNAVNFTIDLPGTASISGTEWRAGLKNGFNLVDPTGSGLETVHFSRLVSDGLYFVDRLNVGEVWDNLPSGGRNIDTWGNTASIYNSDAGFVGDTYGTGSPIYIPFYFTDTSAGNVTKYGYVSLSITTSGSGAAADLTLALNGLAYQDTAATQIAMGAVPESTSAVLVLGAGAFALVRSLRKKLI